jgi:hypothetical protein
MIAERGLPVKELIELAKRVHIPGCEAVYELVHDASFEPGEDWFFDYEKQGMIKGVELLPQRNTLPHT